jgi:16S rRNA (guanine1516-N2)-methyltransferase
MPSSIRGVLAATPAQSEAATELAASLSLPLLNAIPAENYLQWDEQGLALMLSNSGKVNVDFCAKKALYRERRFQHELLLKACGLIKLGPVQHVVDATAGLGADSALLACAAERLTLIERSEIVAALLRDGLQRARVDGRPMIAGRDVQVLNADAVDALSELREVDVIYLDPMFPHKQKNALPPKNMQALQALLATQHPTIDDERNLLEQALAVANYRVVVKRPMKADSLGGIKPQFVVQGKQVRYDCYALRAI